MEYILIQVTLVVGATTPNKTLSFVVGPFRDRQLSSAWVGTLEGELPNTLIEAHYFNCPTGITPDPSTVADALREEQGVPQGFRNKWAIGLKRIPAGLEVLLAGDAPALEEHHEAHA